jgi:hypothetical protein
MTDASENTPPAGKPTPAQPAAAQPLPGQPAAAPAAVVASPVIEPPAVAPTTGEPPAVVPPVIEPPAVAPATIDIVAGPGGVMTDEVGVVTGDLTLAIEVSPDNEAVVRVQYLGAEEWYAVTGARAKLADPADAAAVLQVVAGILNRPEG